MKEEILKLRESGYTYNQIIKRLGCSKSIVSYHCRKNGVSRYDNSIKISNDLIEKMQSFYDSGNSTWEVSKEFNISRHQILKKIKIKNKKIYSLEERKKSKVDGVILWRQKVKLKLIEYKGGKCIVCGYNKCIRSLQFHHIDPKQKDFAISGKSVSFDRLKLETDKCILVCNNCHGEIHEELDKNGYSKIINNINKKSNINKLTQRKVERPQYEQLINEIKELGYSGTGRKYGVSDNSIRKWKKYYEK